MEENAIESQDMDYQDPELEAQEFEGEDGGEGELETFFDNEEDQSSLQEELSAFMGADDEDADEDDDATQARRDERGRFKAKQEAAESEGEPDETSEEEDTQEAKGSSRYQKRVQKLVAARKEAEARAEKQVQEYQGQLQQMQQYMQQMQQQTFQQKAALETRLAETAKELELIRRQHEQQEEENLSPVERLERKIRRETAADLDSKYEARFQELQQQREQELHLRQQQVQEAERRERINGYKQSASDAARKSLDGVDMSAVEKLQGPLETHTLGWAAAFNITPDQAAQEFDKFAFQYVLAKMKSKGKMSAKKLRKSGAAPEVAKASKRPGKGKGSVPSYQQAAEAGFDSVFEYMAAMKQ